MGNKVELLRSFVYEMEGAGLLESGKAELLRKCLKDLDHALKVGDLKKVTKAVDQISRELIK